MNLPDNPPPSRPLHLQTLDSLLAGLIGGSAIPVGEQETDFCLPDKDSRAVLNWYRLNRSKWAGNVTASDLEALVSAVLTAPPVLPIPDSVEPIAGRRLQLTRVVAHRFAGIHAYGAPTAPPPDFVFEPREPITLFEGWNGSGKTSLLNAVIWCLTGHLLRPQRPPEDGQQEFEGSFVRSADDPEESSPHSQSPVTPLPNPARYIPSPGTPVPIDSWVELTFADKDGRLLPPVRRTQMRNPRGKLSQTQAGFETLGVDPAALRIGTLMPAMLQYLQIGSTSELGLAVAQLTGLAEIANLAKHATRTRDKLRGEFKKEREREIGQADARFLEARGDLQKQIDEYFAMKPAQELPAPTPASLPHLEQQIRSLQNHFTDLKADALRAAQAILGQGFDPSDKNARDSLEATIGPARGQLDSMIQLPSVRRSRALAEISADEWRGVDDLIAKLRMEASVLAELTQTPALARRKQLYARAASWMAETQDHDASVCPICCRSLSGALDPLTQRKVAEHLAEVTEEDQRLLSLTLRGWASNWSGTFASKCPSALQVELSRDLPTHPRELIRAALVEELFDTPSFQGALMPLRGGVRLLCDEQLAKLPTFTEPCIEPLPQALDAVSAPLLVSLTRLSRARAFAQWRRAHAHEIAQVTRSILQSQAGTEVVAITETTPLGQKLGSLITIVKGVAPLNVALELTRRMATHLQARRDKETRLQLYLRAATALEALVDLGSLAERQVEALRKMLHTRATYWRDRCYHNSYPMAGHAVRDTAMNVKGVLDIRVGFVNASAPAQHISNASALRANLMGFFLAFWEHVVTERGGLALLVFDDPQELLDHDNKSKFARLLPELVKKGAQVFVATYDRSFASAAVAAGREFASIEHRSVHPVNPCRDVLGTAPALEELNRKRSVYEKDLDYAPAAQDYVNELRIFVEARLADLFDDPAYPAYSAAATVPTLMDHLGHLRSLAKNPPNALFRGKAVTEFLSCKALLSGAACLKVLNTSHHNKSSLSAGSIDAVANELDRILELTESLHREFRHWRWHEPLMEMSAPSNVVPFKPVEVPAFNVPIFPDLAAFTEDSPYEATQDVASECLNESWFANKTLFLIRQGNFGFSIPEGAVAIVESHSYEGKDHDLLIVRQKGHLLARRLLRPPKGTHLALAAQAPDPRESKPTLLFNAGDVVFHRVVGMLTERPAPPPGKGEAIELTSAGSLSHIKAAYCVTNDSGVPLALPGQIVLGGDTLTKDQLAAMEGTLVALSLDNGSAVFKRVGKQVPGSAGRLWQFESVGGLGSSMVVSLVESDENSEAPRFGAARRILGVLYAS